MEKCQGLTKKGAKCKRNASKNGYCNAHQGQFTPETTPETPEIPATTEIQTTTIEAENRALKYRTNPPCPKCGRNSMCMTRRGDYASHRCRQCGHRWEEGKK